MSILLEALRKTEKNQHSREVPTIHAEEQTGPFFEPFRIGPMVLLLVVALFVSGWFVWRQYRVPEGAYQPPVTLGTKEVVAVTVPPATTAGDHTKAATQATQAKSTSSGQRTPVESYQQAIRNISRSKAGVSGAPTDNASAAQTDKAGQAGAALKRLENEGGENTAAIQAVDSGEEGSKHSTTGSSKPPAAAGESYRSPETAPITYWELPDAIRADVPEIKFSVLVYADNPADRFLLVNGQRVGEGDSLESGPVVEEIQVDGVIFSYRLYRFVVGR